MKKILSVVLALCLMMTFTVTAFAESTPDEITPAVSDDPLVVQAWEAVVAIDTAIKNADYAAMEAATNLLDSTVDAMSDEQITEWSDVVDDNMGIENYVDLFMNMLIIEDVKFCMEEYTNDKSSVNAYWFVESCDYAKEENLPVFEMFADLADVYEDAKNNMPSQKIIDIYEAYSTVSDAVWFCDVDEFDNAIAGFEAVLDDFNNLTEEELKALADLLYAESAEEAFDIILSDWMYINICDTMVQLYEDFRTNPDEETARAFAEYYESVLEWKDEDLEYLVSDTIWSYGDEDIEDVYAEANAMFGGGVAPEPEPEDDTKPQTSGQSTKDDKTNSTNTASVQTGMESVAVMGVSVMILMMGVVLFMRKKARQ